MFTKRMTAPNMRNDDNHTQFGIRFKVCISHLIGFLRSFHHINGSVTNMLRVETDKLTSPTEL